MMGGGESQVANQIHKIILNNERGKHQTRSDNLFCAHSLIHSVTATPSCVGYKDISLFRFTPDEFYFIFSGQ